MLEKFAKKDKNFLFDAHFHYAVCKRYGIEIPDFINRDFLRWRWENYNGI